MVPTPWWGVWLGPSDGTGPWTWICEEAINPPDGATAASNNYCHNRVWALGLDGTLYVTDFSGVDTSSDKGCTWTPVTGGISARTVTQVVADPVDGKTAWATTNSPLDELTWNALFKTTDDGATWNAVPALVRTEYYTGVVLSADGQRIYVTSWAQLPEKVLSDAGVPVTPIDMAVTLDGGSRIVDGGLGDLCIFCGTARDASVTQSNLPQAFLHASTDGGKTWSSVPLTYADAPGDSLFIVEPMAIDPANPEVVYLRADAADYQTLLRATSDGKVTPIISAAGVNLNVTCNSSPPQFGIGGVAFNPAKNEMYIATRDGLYVSVDGGAPMPSGCSGRTSRSTPEPMARWSTTPGSPRCRACSRASA